MSKARIKWRVEGFRELRLEPAVQELINDGAEAIAARAGDGYEASLLDGKNRERASVITATFDAILDNARHQTLLRSLDAMGGKKDNRDGKYV